jgi:hypothetical protein
LRLSRADIRTHRQHNIARIEITIENNVIVIDDVAVLVVETLSVCVVA